jgi:hypothetical protein
VGLARKGEQLQVMQESKEVRRVGVVCGGATKGFKGKEGIPSGVGVGVQAG